MKKGCKKSKEAVLTEIIFLFIFAVLIVNINLGLISAFEFNGTAYDINGNRLNNTLINITIRNSDFSLNSTEFVTTNESGGFNITVTDVTNGFYTPVITWTNTTTSAVQFIGQSLPSFPSQILIEISGTDFYLKEAGTLNITAINGSNDRVNFNYQVKDTKLGYAIAENFGSSSVSEAILYVPKDRNYSIMVSPDMSMPVSFEWNNFSSTNDYTFPSGLSTYNATLSRLQYQFNTTMNIVRVSGYINLTGIGGWDEFTVIPYLLEPGNMVHNEWGDLPYNISGFVGGTDVHTLTSGFYNISLPSTPAETSNMILFASARNGSNFYGGFKNISNLGVTGLSNFNFTSIDGLLGITDNVTMEDTTGGGSFNVTTAKQLFTIVNSTNGTLDNANSHVEITLDYSDIGAIEFTWMVDTDQGASTSFTLPLINNTGIKELNAFVSGGNYAPKRTSYTATQLSSPQNITITTFNPGDIDGSLGQSDIFMGLIISNSTCDVPVISDGCFIGGINDQGLDEFNPMRAIFGGGRISFVMGSSTIKVHYVNVDMIASGPPDALFDSSNTESTSGDFESAMRFGSQGPTIYDYALITAPYTEGSTSTTGLDEGNNVNVSIPLFYDDDWNVIWNITANGTSAASLAGNYSHYSARQSEWQTLMNGVVCHENGATAASINASNPCYIDKTNNRIVVRMPHFSGTELKTGGSVVTATSSSSSSSGGGGSSATSATTVYKPTTNQLSGGYEVTLKEDYEVKFQIDSENHTLEIEEITNTTAKIKVSSDPQEATLEIGENKKFDVNSDGTYDLSVTLESITASVKSGKFTIMTIGEEISGSESSDESSDSTITGDAIQGSPEDESSKGKVGGDVLIISWFWIILVFVIFIVAIVIVFKEKIMWWIWYEAHKYF